MPAPSHHQDLTPIDPIAGVLALILPGGGHVFQHRFKRGILIALGVLGLFFGGLLIGGLSVVDLKSPRTETRISFVAQVLVGPIAIAANAIHQSSFKTTVSPGVDNQGRPQPSVIAPPGQNRLTISLGKVNEIGVLYTVLAGMLNFIAFLDALLPPARRAPVPATPVRTTGTLDAVLARGNPR